MRTPADLRWRVRLRHLERPDIPERVDLLYDDKVRTNITSLLALTARDELVRRFERQVDCSAPERMDFVITKPNGEVIGYTHIYALDWVNHTCKFGVMILPPYRVGFGYAAVRCTYDYLYGCLNMRAVVNGILDCNEMMSSRQWNSRRADVQSPAANFTDGTYRTVYRWSDTRSKYDTVVAAARARHEVGSPVRQARPEERSG